MSTQNEPLIKVLLEQAVVILSARESLEWFGQIPDSTFPRPRIPASVRVGFGAKAMRQPLLFAGNVGELASVLRIPT